MNKINLFTNFFSFLSCTIYVCIIYQDLYVTYNGDILYGH